MNHTATAIQQAIAMVRSRMELMNETLMGKHSTHHIQQIERGLYDLLEKEKDQICNAYTDGLEGPYLGAEEYYNKTYNTKIK